MLLIIAVPYVALAEQWVDELKMFNIVPINCFGARDSWTKDLSLKIDSLLSQSIEFAAIVVVNKTLISEKFQSEIRRVPESRTCFIGDEVHHHSAEFINKKLPPAVWRLGLSATPYSDRTSDDLEEFEQESRKSRLETYYGDIVATYSLGDALADRVLTPYNYYLFEVYLTAVETDKYINLSHQIGRLMNIDKSRNNEALNSLLRKRNRIIANAEKKLDALDEVLKAEKLIDKSYTLFYVGEGKAGVDDDDDDLRDEQEDEVSQLDEVAKVIRKNNWKVSSFTARESKGDRIKIMNSFTEGSIDALVSMRVLDEGIDIPKCQRAFILASSRNSRQFIQRRGRILRKYPNKELAHIYDFLVVPSPNNKDSNCTRLVESELRRAKEFMMLSANQESARMDMDKIADIYGINLEDIECE